ncbi:MAG: lipopolysaccharide biosynthesis protein [Candidatus Acidiferrales bacterium]
MEIFNSRKSFDRVRIAAWLSPPARAHAREYAPTFAAEFAVLGCQIVAYKLAAHFLGHQGFSEYAVARRAISTLYPVCLLGLGVALARSIARADGEGAAENGRVRSRDMGAALMCVGGVTTLAVAAINMFSGTFAYLVFGDAAYRALAAPISLVIAGLILHAIAYAYFRGHLQMTAANTLQLVNLGLVPLAAFLLVTRTAGAVLEALGAATIVVAMVALACAPSAELRPGTRRDIAALLRYGAPRVPGDFAQMALLGLPAFFVAHWAGVQQAGYVAFAISFLSMISAAFSPIGSILLPKASRMIASGARGELRDHLWSLARITVLVSSVLIVLTFVFADRLIRLYLGPGYGDVAHMLRMICVGAAPYSLFLVMRNAVDAHHEGAVTSLFLVGALGIFGLGAGCVFLKWAGWSFVLEAFLVSLFVLSALTCAQAVRIFGMPPRRNRPAPPVTAAPMAVKVESSRAR